MSLQIWVGHVVYGLVLVTRWPKKLTRSRLSEGFRVTTGSPTDVGWVGLACSSSDIDRQSAQTGSKYGLNFPKQCVQFCEILIL